MNKTYTVKEVAEILGYSTNSIYTFIKEKRIKGIRVGLGRFRITQSELNRLLNEKKSTINENITSSLSQASDNADTKIQGESQGQTPSLTAYRGSVIISTTTLFDWFLSMVSIITGFGFLLFMTESKYAGSLYFLFFPISVGLGILGIISFIHNSINQTKKDATNVFVDVTTGFLYFLLAILLVINRDIHGGLIYGLLSFVIFLEIVFYDIKINFLLTYFTLISILLPFVFYIFPGFVNLHDYPILYSYPSWLIISVWALFSIFANVIIWWSTRKNNMFINILFVLLINIPLILISNMYGVGTYWERACLLIFLMTFSFISYFYEKIDKRKAYETQVFFNSFFQILIIAIVTLALLFLNQKNILNSLRSEVMNELTYGKLIVGDTLQISKEQLKNLSKNSTFTKAYKDKDMKVMTEDLKSLYIAANVFRRVLVADKDGNILSLYPPVVLSNMNVSFRDYFKETRQLKDSVVTDPFEVVVDNREISSVSVTAPIINDNQEFDGIIIGSIDLNKLSDDLQKYSDRENKFYQLIDKNGLIFVKPSYLNLPSNLNKESVIWNVFSGKNGFAEQSVNNTPTLISYDRMSATNWAISLQMPFSGAYEYETVYGVLAITMLFFVNIFIIYVNYNKYKK